MTLLEAQEIFAYWQESPPIHLAFKAFMAALGASKTKPDWRRALGDPRQPTGAAANDDIARLVSAPPPGLTVARGQAPRRRSVFDIAELRRRNQAAAARREAHGG